MFTERQLKLAGLAAEDGDDAEQHEEVKEEEPLVVDNKPFVIKKFREALRTSSFITGNLNL